MDFKVESGQCTRAEIEKLLDLYVLAVEHHDKTSETKRQYYESKMQQLLIKPLVIMLLQGKTAEIEELKRTQNVAQLRKQSMAQRYVENT